MTLANSFKIENGVFGLKLVDKQASGYLAGWQTPGGKDIKIVTINDYTGTAGISFQCQTTTSALTPSANSNDDTTPATMCNAEVTTTIVGVTSWVLDASLIQDPQISAGISAYLFENDTKEAYFYLGMGGDAVAPAAVGRCSLQAAALGGDARVTLTADVSLPVSPKPDIWVGLGTGAATRAIYGAGGPPATGATAGTPGTFTPAGAVAPSNLAAMTGVTATPATSWTTGQFVTLGDGSWAYWNATAWTAGKKP